MLPSFHLPCGEQEARKDVLATPCLHLLGEPTCAIDSIKSDGDVHLFYSRPLEKLVLLISVCPFCDNLAMYV